MTDLSSETWEIIRKLRGDEIELQIAFQCAPLITGLKESNLLNIEKQDYQLDEKIFLEKVNWRFIRWEFMRGRLQGFCIIRIVWKHFFPKKACRHCA